MGRHLTNINGKEIGPYKIKIVDYLDVDRRIFECPVCTRPFVAQVSNIHSGTVRDCGCLNRRKNEFFKELIKQRGTQKI